MQVEQQFLFFFSALGVFNGMLLAGYFCWLKPKKLSNYFLAALLIMICIRISKSIFFYFNPALDKTFLQIGLSAYFMIGPFLYFYVKAKLASIETPIKWKIHLGILVSVILSIGLSFPYKNHPELWGKYYWVFYYQWLFYLCLSGYLLKGKLQLLISKSPIEQSDIWLLSIFIGNAIIWFAHYSASYTSYIVGALSFSFVFYLLILLFIFRPKTEVVNESHKYADKKISEDEAKVIIDKLGILMDEEALYKDPNLTMPKLAKKLNILTPRLSQLVNDNLNKSFTLFINEYRIKSAKSLLTQEKPMKMEVISERCGFNSNSTFYAVFKKIAGTTPAKYRESVK